jgi:glutathione S-transferase
MATVERWSEERIMSAKPVLVGQYDSPFVRRVAVAMHHYGVVFERRVLSTFADFDAMLKLSPLGKVPVLVLPDGEHLWDSRAILDFLHGQAPPQLLLLPQEEPARHQVLRVEAAALGLAEKAYERGVEFARRSPGTQDPAWIVRLERQIGSTLAWLEGQADAPFLIGGSLSVADVTTAVTLTFITEKWPRLAPAGAFPALERHRTACEMKSMFQAAPYSAAEAAQSGWRPEPA